MSKCQECPPEGAPGWMVTYGDLMTLLLCFFVLLFSFSSLDKKQFETMKDTMTAAFGVMSGSSTSMGSGIARKTQKLVDKSFDQAVSEVVMEIKDKKTPKERLILLKQMVMEASKALKLIGEEKREVQRIVHQLEDPRSVTDRRRDNRSIVQQETQEDETPKNQSEENLEFAASSHNREELETAKQQIEPMHAKGDSFSPNRSDNTQQDVSAGRDQVLLENTGRQRTRDMLSGRNRPLEGQQDKELRRSEDRNFDFKRPSNMQETMEEYQTLAGLIKFAPHDASHALFHLETSLLFEEDGVELKELAKEMVYRLFRQKYLEDEAVTFQIEAHTDFSFVPTEKYPSSWHLASARAQAVINFLLEEDQRFDPARFAVVSFGSWQPKYRYLPGQTRLPQNSRLEVRTIREP